MKKYIFNYPTILCTLVGSAYGLDEMSISNALIGAALGFAFALLITVLFYKEDE